MLLLAPILTLAVFLVPIGAGLVFTLLPAFGYFPAIGGTAFSLQPWRDLVAYPGFATSLRLTLTVGIAATLLSLASARAMGYRRSTAWIKTVLPQVYPQIRLPVYAVLAFSLSVVEVGLILAPGNPPPLSILAARWFSDYDLKLYFPAAAAATLQL